MGNRLIACVLCAVAACGDDGGGASGTLISADEGGEVTSADGAFKLVIPAGSLAEDARITISVVPQDDWPAQTADLPPVSEVYDLAPDGLEFSIPALAVHTLAADALRTGNALRVVAHEMVGDDGVLEQAARSQIYVTDTRTVITSEIPHTSRHWAADRGSRLTVDLDVQPSYAVGAQLAPRSIVVESPKPLQLFQYWIRAIVPAGQSTVVSVVHDGWMQDPGVSRDVPDLVWTYIKRFDAFATPSAPFSIEAPLPTWRCAAAGPGRLYAGFEADVADEKGPSNEFSFDVLIDLGETMCTGPGSGPQTFTTLAKPEGVDLFHVGPNAPAGLPILVAPGLLSGTYAAVAGGDVGGGLDLVNLATGARQTNMFVDVSPAYGVTAYQTVTGPRWTVFGGGGTATAGWNDTAMDFGGTAIGAFTNTTQVTTADFDGNGVAESVMTTAPSNQIHVDSAIIDGTAFAGGEPGVQRISAQFGRNASEVLVALSDGRMFFGAVVGAAGRLALVGDVGTSARLMSCAGALPRICAIANYAEDTLHVVKIDANGPRIIASQPTGDAPIDPSVTSDGTEALIAMTGSGDNSLEVFALDIAQETVSVKRPRETLAGCVAPNHSRLLRRGQGTSALISCYGSDKLQVVDLGF